MVGDEWSLERVISGRDESAWGGYGMYLLPDGKSYATITDGGTKLQRYDFETGNLLETLFDISTARECPFQRFDSYILSPNGRYLLLLADTEPIYRRSRKSNVYLYELSRRLVEPLSEKEGKIMIPTFSPDGRMVAFVRDNNIFIKKLEFNTEVAVTTDGSFGKVINGATDWVYEEEFETTKLMSWSPDGKFLSYVRTDETAVPEVAMPIYGDAPKRPGFYSYKYPMAGDTNSTVTVHLYDVQQRRSKEVELPGSKVGAYANKEHQIEYIPRIDFAGDKLAVTVLNRRQNHLRLFSVDTKSLLPKLIYQDTDEAYIDTDVIGSLNFYNRGFAITSQRDGYNHIYSYDLLGRQERQITKGAWDVTDFYGVDDAGNFYYQAVAGSPVERGVYRSDSKGRKVALMSKRGVNSARFSPSYQYYIGYSSSKDEPMLTAVYRTGAGRPKRVLEDNKRLREDPFLQAEVRRKQFIQLPNGKGELLNAWLLLPEGFDETKKYPLVMMQYSGPGSQRVMDSWSIGWEYELSRLGFIVATVDGRGTGGRGRSWKKCTYLKLGELEAQDQVAAAKYFGNKSYIDAERIAIWGWSFGGYMALKSLIVGRGTFAAGVSVAPVTDWRFYDTIYTERYMRTPQENPEGYKRTSVLEHAEELKGKLLIIHGSADDNVQLANTMTMTARLVASDIPFEEAVYTDKDHSIRGGKTRLHLYRKMTDFLARMLKP